MDFSQKNLSRLLLLLFIVILLSAVSDYRLHLPVLQLIIPYKQQSSQHLSFIAPTTIIMGNSSSSSGSLCCIALDEMSITDENTLRTKSAFNANKLQGRLNVKDMLTAEERYALKTSKDMLGTASINEGSYSFSSISSKSSTRSVDGNNNKAVDDEKWSKIVGVHRRFDSFSDMDEGRNDTSECCKCIGDEVRASISNYDESAGDALVSYYQSESEAHSHRHNLRSRGGDDRRE